MSITSQIKYYHDIISTECNHYQVNENEIVTIQLSIIKSKSKKHNIIMEWPLRWSIFYQAIYLDNKRWTLTEVLTCAW